MKFLFRYMDPRLAAVLYTQRRYVGLGLACSLISAVMATAVLFGLVFEALKAVGSQNEAAMVLVSASVVLLYVVKYWFTRGQAYYLSKAANYLTADLRVQLFRKLQKLPMAYFNDQRAGAIQSVLTNDVAVYQNAVSATKDSVDGPVKIVSSIGAAMYFNWQLTLVSIAVFPLIWLFIEHNKKQMRVAQDAVQNDLSNLTAMMQESLQGTRIIKAFSAEDKMTTDFERLTTASLASQMHAARRMAALRPTVELIGAVGLAFVVYLLAKTMGPGSLKIETLGPFLFSLDGINQGVRSLGSLKQTMGQVEAGTERIYSEILDVPETQVDLPTAHALPAPEGRIEFRNVSFTYPDGTVALKNVSFCIDPGLSLALVGPSGSGKSTIADLMLRFYDPTSGQIFFDGVDIRELKIAWLRSQIGVVPQQTFLFAGTIYDNLRLGKPDATEDECRQAARAAHADVFINQMPARYGSELGERGTRLSGGEMQRVAIARALVRKPTMLLLDEATSALDAVSEKAVQEALDEIMRERTTLFIAHRLTTAARAARILVLRKGEVVECGSHQELMEQDGAYAGMVRAFNSGVLDDSVG